MREEIFGSTGDYYDTSHIQLECVDRGTVRSFGQVMSIDKVALVLRNCALPKAGTLLLTSEDFVENSFYGGYNRLLSSVNALHKTVWEAGYNMTENVPVNSMRPHDKPFFIHSDEDGFTATIRGNASKTIYASGRKKVGLPFLKSANPDLKACMQSLTRAYLSGQFNRLHDETIKLDGAHDNRKMQYLLGHHENAREMMEEAFEAETPVMKDFIVPYTIS